MFDIQILPVMSECLAFIAHHLTSIAQKANLCMIQHSKITTVNQDRSVHDHPYIYICFWQSEYCCLPQGKNTLFQKAQLQTNKALNIKLHWHLLIHHSNPEKKISEAAASNTLNLPPRQHYNLELDWKVTLHSDGHCCCGLYSVACRIPNDFTQTKLLWSVNMFSKADKKECWCQVWQVLLSLRVHSKDTA